ncbi:MAG: hypothetical protein K9G76_01785 [Bacteroidales bacterium]|nr:hypothetical protein [Bacteroidales bacterium]MCF8403285.1 hypothetical protein [Bacteroidales bacterium]
MKKLTLISFMLLATSLIAISQIDKMRDKLDDASAEEEGLLTLRFFNAETGEGVPDAMINVQDIGTLTTDIEGKIRFEKLGDAVYPFQFEKKGFISENNKFEVVAGTIFWNRFTVSPTIEMGSIRIVLDWDKKPSDLDAHFVKEGEYHISYREKTISNDGKAKLDRDDRDGYGPETITVKDIDEKAEYTYYVKDFTNKDSKNSKQLSKSMAMVKIYGEGKLLNIWQLNEKQKGNAWVVFNIQNGKLIPTDEVKNYY